MFVVCYVGIVVLKGLGMVIVVFDGCVVINLIGNVVFVMGGIGDVFGGLIGVLFV